MFQEQGDQQQITSTLGRVGLGHEAAGLVLREERALFFFVAVPGLVALLVDADGFGPAMAMDGLDESQCRAVDGSGRGGEFAENLNGGEFAVDGLHGKALGDHPEDEGAHDVVVDNGPIFGVAGEVLFLDIDACSGEKGGEGGDVGVAAAFGGCAFFCEVEVEGGGLKPGSGVARELGCSRTGNFGDLEPSAGRQLTGGWPGID